MIDTLVSFKMVSVKAQEFNLHYKKIFDEKYVPALILIQNLNTVLSIKLILDHFMSPEHSQNIFKYKLSRSGNM
jgi:hypothetical protein